MKNIHIITRLTIALGSLLVIAAYFVPLWEIKLWAPQYPEGLSIEIWYNDVKGDVDIINGLNHYIGMKHIKREMFPEFIVLKFIIAAFILWGLLVAWMGKLKWLILYCSSMVIGGIIALLDFYRWGYDYGHNLDPTAPIQVPGMAYQPPVLGYKELLNFMALSIPSTGGWIIVGLGVAAFILLVFEIWSSKKTKPVVGIIALFAFTSFAFACGEQKPEIKFGKDDCDNCKMKLMDNRFGFALVTTKGRTYKFDDYNCYKGFSNESKPDIKQSYVVVFDKPGVLIPVATAFYLKSMDIKSPMGSGVAAFSSQEACHGSESVYHATCITYNQLSNNQ